MKRLRRIPPIEEMMESRLVIRAELCGKYAIEIEKVSG